MRMKPVVPYLVAITTAIVGMFAISLVEDEWKPSGDGRTIVNTTTGEIRVTSTGESIEEYRSRTKAEAVAAAAAAEEKWVADAPEREKVRLANEAIAKQRQEEIVRRKAAAESSRIAEEAKLHAADQARLELQNAQVEATRVALEAQKAIALENGGHYHAIQIAIFSIAPPHRGYISEKWRGLTTDFRSDEAPDKKKRDDFSWVIADALRRGDISGQQWEELYDHLEALKYNAYGRLDMNRTPEQLEESRQRMLAQ